MSIVFLLFAIPFALFLLFVGTMLLALFFFEVWTLWKRMRKED